jgi:hypothetical protein
MCSIVLSCLTQAGSSAGSRDFSLVYCHPLLLASILVSSYCYLFELRSNACLLWSLDGVSLLVVDRGVIIILSSEQPSSICVLILLNVSIKYLLHMFVYISYDPFPAALTGLHLHIRVVPFLITTPHGLGDGQLIW